MARAFDFFSKKKLRNAVTIFSVNVLLSLRVANVGSFLILSMKFYLEFLGCLNN
jgi:hypothetical protein